MTLGKSEYKSDGGIRIVNIILTFIGQTGHHVLLNVAIHDRNGQCCPAKVQARTFETTSAKGLKSPDDKG